jgi:hypothetical protein
MPRFAARAADLALATAEMPASDALPVIARRP